MISTDLKCKADKMKKIGDIEYNHYIFKGDSKRFILSIALEENAYRKNQLITLYVNSKSKGSIEVFCKAGIVIEKKKSTSYRFTFLSENELTKLILTIEENKFKLQDSIHINFQKQPTLEST